MRATSGQLVAAPNERRLVWGTTDVDEAQHRISRILWPQELRVIGGTGGFAARLDHTAITTGLGISELSYGHDEVASTLHHPGRQAYLVHLPLTGVVDMWAGQHRIHVTNDDTATVAQPHHPTIARWHPGATQLVIALDAALVADVVWQLAGIKPTPGSLRFHPSHTITGPMRAWADLVHAVRRAADTTHDLTTHPVTGRYIAQMLTASLLLAATNSHTRLLHRGGNDRATNITAWINDHADLPITPSDIAAAARLSTRTLYRACNGHLGVAPAEYIRRLRLSRSRRDLTAAAPDGTVTVTTVAHAHGFGSLSYFARVYRRTYGERPSDTLRRHPHGHGPADPTALQPHRRAVDRVARRACEPGSCTAA